MIYAILATSGLSALFLFLWIRSIIDNTKLQDKITELSKNADINQKQLEIASLPARSDTELADRLRQGNL